MRVTKKTHPETRAWPIPKPDKVHRLDSAADAIDWLALAASMSEVERLRAAGRWTETEFTRVYNEQMDIVHDDEDLLSGLLAQCPDEWFT